MSLEDECCPSGEECDTSKITLVKLQTNMVFMMV